MLETNKLGWVLARSDMVSGIDTTAGAGTSGGVASVGRLLLRGTRPERSPCSFLGPCLSRRESRLDVGATAACAGILSETGKSREKQIHIHTHTTMQTMPALDTSQ
jgi:hypothetical protein